MAQIKTAYAATNEHNEGFICEAKNKAAMKRFGMNMKLEWKRFKDFKAAQMSLIVMGTEIKSCTVVPL